ncbi:MAG: 2,3-bisphosphoglycerate-independent phosphoglycerate mutase [Candidatus Paceibacterota bacterium]
MPNSKSVTVVILDGWGYREETQHNAVAEAKTPCFDKLWQECPHTLLEASGLAVGLPEGQMGNSEVGHSTIGSGTTIYTDLVRISKSAKDKGFERKEVLIKLFDHVKNHDSTLHLLSLIGNGGVHAHGDHLLATLQAAKNFGLQKVAIHAFTDGRDTAPQSAHDFLLELENEISQIGLGFISTMSGRYFAMDRDNNWDRLKKAEDAIFNGEGRQAGSQKALEVAKFLYSKGQTDEHFEPVVFLNTRGEKELIKENDGVFFLNFRADRARMMSKKIMEFGQDKNIHFVTLTQYDKNFTAPVVFPPEKIETTLAKEISQAGLTQAHIAETEKFPHVTYFFNGGREQPHDLEKHILIPSRKDVATHDLAPEMKAKEIADKAIEEIDNGTNFIFINFANPDMVGHTANRSAIVTAVETVDRELERVRKAVEEKGGTLLVTADHGNAEINTDPVTGEKHTAHTTSLVPFICTDKNKKLKKGTLADVAPTVLSIFAISKPKAMTGQTLLVD